MLVFSRHLQADRNRARAASKRVDTDLTSDLGVMIERTEAELATLVKKIEALPD